MSKTIIKVENLGKKYSIGDKQKFYTLRDSITGIFDFNKKREPTNDFWALRDINFEVKQGESVGIIGRNGAGKSTLLKILSQITPPTTGKITLHGRVASLLEVGTGFHQELTGRENIFLNGAILGMSRAEIKHKFDEIVAFSEVEKFLDMPVKHYSSGMYMRLAFAVAAHLESEILIVDEVLAVGDAQFQKKCLGKMDEVAKKEGRTVLFVSHNMAAIEHLCSKSIYISEGHINYFGYTKIGIQRYLSSDTLTKSLDFSDRKDRKGSHELLINSVSFIDGKSNLPRDLISGNYVKIYLEFINPGNIKSASISVSFNSIYGQRILTLWSKFSGDILSKLPKHGYFECSISKFSLRPGEYSIDVYAENSGSLLDVIYNAAQVTVNIGDYYGSGNYPSESQGDMMVEHSWKVIRDTKLKV